MSKMPEPIKSEYNGKKYQSNITHRTKHNPDKSQWTILETDEIDIFKKTVDKNWFVVQDKGKEYGYGIYLPQEKECTLIKVGEYMHNGETKELFFVKFVLTEERDNLWHGFPCGNKESDFFKLKNFRPILEEWISNRFITKAEFFKFYKGYK